MLRRITLLTLALFSAVLLVVPPALAQVTNQGATTVASGQLSVAHGVAYASRHGVYLMVYETPSGVQGRFVNTSGAAVGSAFMVAARGGNAYVNKPMVAYSTDTADDVFFVMFATDYGKAYDAPPSAYIQRVSFTGTGGALVGGRILASDGVYELPNDLVYNPFTRRFVAVWERIFPGATAGADVELRFFTAAGVPVGGIVNVSNANWSQGAAKAAVDWQTNRIMIAYQGVSPTSPAYPEVLGLWAKIVDGSTGALLTGLLTVQNGFTIEPVPVFSPERKGFVVAWTGFSPGRDVQGRFVSSANGSIGSMPSGVYAIAATNRSEGAAMGMYDAISRRVLMAVQSSGACPNDACPFLDGAILDAQGVPLSVFTGLSTAVPSTSGGGSFYPDVAVGDGGQFGISYTLDYIADYVQRVKLPAASQRGPKFGDGGSDDVVVSPNALSFSVVKSGATINGFSPQNVSVSFASNPVAWSAATSSPFLQVTSATGNGSGQFVVTVINPGDVIGSQTSLSGSVVLTATGAPNSPVTLPVTVTVATGGKITNQGATTVSSGQLSVAHGVAYAARHNVYLMVYETPSGVQGRFVNTSGTPVGSAFMVAARGGNAYVNKPMVAYSTDTADDVFFVMFATDYGKAYDAPPSAYIQRVSFTGTGGALVGSRILASDGVYELPNDLVYNPYTRRFVAVWERIFPGATAGADVELRFFTAAGVPVGGIVNVSNANWSQGAAKAAVDWQTNRIMIAYQGVSPTSPAFPEVLGLWAKIVDGSTGALLTGLLTVQNGFTIEPVPVFVPERGGFVVAWTGFSPGRDVMGRFVSSANGSIGSMPAGVYAIAATNRSEGAAMGMYDAISRRVLMAVQSSGACPNDACPFLDGAILDAQGVPLSVFTGLSTAVPSTSGGGSFYPDVAVGEGGQFGISYTLDYISDHLQRVVLSAAAKRGPVFGGIGKVSPADGATGLSTSPTLQWSASTVATGYEYCIDTTNDNACSTWISTGTNTSVQVTGLNGNTVYHWQARAITGGGLIYADGTTAFWSLTTSGPVLPGAFVKTAPTSGATGQSTSPTLVWGASSGATSYEYCYDTTHDGACSNWVSAGANTSVTLSGLAADTLYSWHVRARNGAGATYSGGSTTEFRIFKTLPTPGAFSRTAPADAATKQPLNPTLNWGTSSNAASYEYCYDTSNNNTCSGWTSTGANTSVVLGNLASGTTYYWHVRAINTAGTTYAAGSANLHWSFTTVDLLPFAVGQGPLAGNGGWFQIKRGRSAGFSPANWQRVPWGAYNAAGGEVRPAFGDVDGDGKDEVVLGLGPDGAGWIAVLDDAENDYALLKWIRVDWAAYNQANGEVYPAVADLDGDGKAEIVAGLGPGGKGWIEIFEDAAHNFAHLAWKQVAWAAYNAGDAPTHPAAADLDGDGKAEIVIGLGSGSFGWLEILGDATTDFAHKDWIQVAWKVYDVANGTTYPAAGDVDGDGKAEIVVGLGTGGKGWVEVFDDAAASYAHVEWIQTAWTMYTAGSGEVHPAVGNLDDDAAAEIVFGFASQPNNGGWVEIRDDASNGFKYLGSSNLEWVTFRAAGGATWPAIGKWQ